MVLISLREVAHVEIKKKTDKKKIKMRTKINLKIYECKCFLFHYNHTEICINEQDFWFGPQGLWSEKANDKTSFREYLNLENIVIGRIHLNHNAVDVIYEKYGTIYAGSLYNLLSFNCRHFCQQVLEDFRPINQTLREKDTYDKGWFTVL